MNRIVLAMLVLSLPVACANWGCTANKKSDSTKQQSEQTYLGQSTNQRSEWEKAIAAIKELGGRIWIEEKSPDNVSVDLRYTRVTDAGLANLKGLISLQSLYLWNTQVTDAGLENIKELTKLRTLDLSQTQVTDAGLINLKELTQLEELDLGFTQITDAGLENIKGLTRLQRLNLSETKVTDVGVKKIQQELSNCKIEQGIAQ
jgi:Leucine-rich repeat (LRR) protein